MMKSNQRIPLSLGGPSNRSKVDFDDQTMMTEFTKQTTASAPPTLSKFATAHAPSSSSKKHNYGRRRASASFVPAQKDARNDFEFPNAFTEDPFAPGSAGGKTDGGFPPSTTAKRAPTRRTSVDGTSRRDRTAFGDAPFAAVPSSSKPLKHHESSQKRQNGQGTADSEAVNFASLGGLAADAPKKSRPQPPAPPAPPAPMVSSNGADTGANSCQEIALPPLVGSERPASKPAIKENPLLSIPDPLSEHRQQQDNNFFAEMPAATDADDFFADSAFGVRARFSDDDASDGGDFSDEGTILWEEGGVIVSKAEKYNRSSGSLTASSSFLNLSGENFKFDQGNEASNKNKASRRSSTGRKRLHGLERRHSRRNMDDDLTTATPSTRISTDSEYSASTTRSKKSTAAGVELKTGSLLSDLVLIMDGKVDISGGNEKECNKDKGLRSSRRRSAVGNEGGMRQSRRRSTDGTDNSDPFVVRQEGRGENMRSFSKVSRSKSNNESDIVRRRPPGRTKSSAN